VVFLPGWIYLSALLGGYMLLTLIGFQPSVLILPSSTDMAVLLK